METICPMARAPWPVRLLAAALLGGTLAAGVQAPAAAQRAGETAARTSPRSPSAARPVLPAGMTGIPPVLAASEADRLQRIFSAQARGDFAAAQRETAALEDRRLLGHVLADRWARNLGPAPSATELSAWLDAHGDHPDAARLHERLARALPRGAALPPAPEARGLETEAGFVPEERDPGLRTPVNPALLRSVRERAREGEAGQALRLVQSARGITPPQSAMLRAEIGRALFQQGRDEEAFAVASDAVRLAPGMAHPAYVAGLAAWGMRRPDFALPYFEAAARAEDASAAQRSAAAFWTARAALRARRPDLHIPWLLQAAQEQRTFYGLVARRALGLPAGFAWEATAEGATDAAALAETAGGWRALALIQIGQRERAEAELRRLWPHAQGNAALARAMLFVAAQANLTDLAGQLATLAQGADGRPRDFARFPLPPFSPSGGFNADPALLFALARQESNFEPGAVSRAGARGLMQLMPATAAYVAADPSLRGRGGHARLHDPAFSMELAQRYLHYLADHEVVRSDLIRLLAAYNNGPGNLGRWLPASRHGDDPFLFIESIPIGETRAFVQRVLAYSWIYASRLNMPAPSLDSLAAGRFPRFAGPSEVAAMLERGAARTRLVSLTATR
jgi:soluble lytic murein transglycosylase-like protein